jgi:hypothetical protein
MGLRDVLEAHGELLPVSARGKTFYIYHVTTVLDALDDVRSVVERFSNGRIMRVIKYALREDVIAERDVFRMTTEKWKIFGLRSVNWRA